jgi:hypothetical protein
VDQTILSWMMYRSGWGFKDDGQRRVLAVEITREGFNWALAHSHDRMAWTMRDGGD